MRQCVLFLICVMAFTACAPPPAQRHVATGSVEVQPRVAGAAEAVVEATPEAALERAKAALTARCFVISALPGPSGTLEASSRGQPTADWASCPRITVRDPFSEALRSQRASAGEVSTRVTVSAKSASATTTRVAVRALYIGSYLNSFTNTPQQAACRSTGVLEQQVIEAVRAGAS
jgi:hypothetical protein